MCEENIGGPRTKDYWRYIIVAKYRVDDARHFVLRPHNVYTSVQLATELRRFEDKQSAPR